MNLSTYEKLYACAYDAEIATKGLDTVVAILRQHTESPVTPKEIGLMLFGEEYSEPVTTSHPYRYNMTKASQRAHLGQMMRHLHKAKLIKRAYIDGEAIERATSKWVQDGEPYNEPQYITVHDDRGRSFEIRNPHYDVYEAMKAERAGHYEEVTETIIPKIKAWIWVGD